MVGTGSRSLQDRQIGFTIFWVRIAGIENAPAPLEDQLALHHSYGKPKQFNRRDVWVILEDLNAIFVVQMNVGKPPSS